MGKFSSAYSVQNFRPRLALIFPSLLCRYDPAGSKSKGRCVKSLLCFPCFHGLCAVGLLHICMCYIGARPTQIVFKIILLFFKKYLDGLS